MNHDVLIVGAGPAGLAFARSLAPMGLKVALVEKNSAQAISDPKPDGRDIAMTHLSKRILEQLGVWQTFDPEAISFIREARVVDGTSPYPLSFDGDGPSGEPLGYLVSNHLIRKALFDSVKDLAAVEIITDKAVETLTTDASGGTLELSDGSRLRAPLVVAADTRFSETRRKMGISADLHDFGRVAIVCWMTHELPHENIAHECFHYGRTLAVLPMPGKMSSIVITVPTHMAQGILDMDERSFNADIEQRFGGRLGAMKLQGERHAYPLVAVHANRFAAQRFALIGDAAVGMHPVTAHGFNLGLSGQDMLAAEIESALAAGRDIGSDGVLQRYQWRHMQVSRPLFHGTNGVVGLFTDDRLPVKIARKAVLHASNHLPPVKWLIKKKLTSKAHWALPPLPLLPPLPKLPSFLSLPRKAQPARTTTRVV